MADTSSATLNVVTYDDADHHHHIWDNGMQVYLGGFDTVHSVARRVASASETRWIVSIWLSLHTSMLASSGVLCVYIQLKFPDVSPYATDFNAVMMNLAIIGTSFYVVSLVVTGILAARNYTEFVDLMNKISLLVGSLSMISELLVLVAPFGWIALVFWIICLLYFMCKSFKGLKKLYKCAVAHLVQDYGECRQTLIDWHSCWMANNVEADNPNISNDGRTTDIEAQNMNTNNDAGAVTTDTSAITTDGLDGAAAAIADTTVASQAEEQQEEPSGDDKPSRVKRKVSLPTRLRDYSLG